MLHISDLQLHFGDRVVFDGLNFSIQQGEKVALIGRNGAGKTTLFRMISGEYRPDGGRLEIPPGWRIGYLSQDIQRTAGETVWEIAMSAFVEKTRIEDELAIINHQLESNVLVDQALEDALHRLEEIHLRLHMMGYEQADGQVSRVLKGLGFKETQFHQPMNQLSGGWQVRVWLSKLLLEKPDLMMLDEPTNHLDIEAILWLERYLAQSEMALLIVSHDRRFLQSCTTRVIELVLGRIDDYNMSYDRYIQERVLRMQQRQEAIASQQRKMNQMQATIDRFRAKANKASMAKSMEKQLAKMEVLEEIETDDRRMNIRFQPPPRSGEVVFKGTQLSKVYGQRAVFSNVDIQINRGDRIAFIGQNGQGKTTLARIVTRTLREDSGEVAQQHQVFTGYYAQDQSERLDPKKTVLQTMEDAAGPETRSQVRGILGAFLFSGDDVDKKVSVLSGGERARLALAQLMLHPINLLVLDEPTNHLDMAAKDVLKQAVMNYQGTLLVVSHDRDFLSGMCDKIFYFRDGSIQPYLGDIDLFLKEKAVEDERLLAGITTATMKKTQESIQTINNGGDPEAKKQAKRSMDKCEKEMDRLSRKKADLELRMADQDFYLKPDMQRIVDEYDELKRTIADTEAAWEAAAMVYEQS